MIFHLGSSSSLRGNEEKHVKNAVWLVAACLLMSACGTEDTVSEPVAAKRASSRPSTGGGSPLLQNVHVVVVFWGSQGIDPKLTQNLGGFFNAFLHSTYLGGLTGYTAGGPKTLGGDGNTVSLYTITPGTSGSDLSMVQIAEELKSQIQQGRLPAPMSRMQQPSSDTVYMLYFPKNVGLHSPSASRPSGQATSCVDFCGSHGSVGIGKAVAFYGVIPDMTEGSGCDTRCGGGSSGFNTATSVSSHELIEALMAPHPEAGEHRQ
jgi:hypothetical protein